MNYKNNIAVVSPFAKQEGGLRLQGIRKCGELGRPLITIITATYNSIECFPTAIESVRAQTYDNVEWIVVDGASSDDTLDLFKQNEDVIDYWISEPDKGIYDAWNKGIGFASGEWIAFLGADDSYFEGALEAYVTLIVNYRDSQLDYISSRVNLTEGCKKVRTIGQPWNWKTFQRYMTVAHVGSLHSRALFKKYGLYDTAYRICGDYELLLRPREKLKAAYIDFVSVNMSIGGSSDSSLALYEAERAKVLTGGRNSLLSYIEKMIAVGKLKLRKWLWY